MLRYDLDDFNFKDIENQSFVIIFRAIADIHDITFLSDEYRTMLNFCREFQDKKISTEIFPDLNQSFNKMLKNISEISTIWPYLKSTPKSFIKQYEISYTKIYQKTKEIVNTEYK